MLFEPDDWADVRVLLDLADNPRHDVKTTTETGNTAVIIPDYLYERFLAYKSLESEQ